MDRHLPPATYLAGPSLSRTTTQHSLTPSLSLQVSLQQPASAISHSVSLPQPAKSAWLPGSFCVTLVPTLKLLPALMRQPTGRSHPCHLRPLSRPTTPRILVARTFFHHLLRVPLSSLCTIRACMSRLIRTIPRHQPSLRKKVVVDVPILLIIFIALFHMLTSS